MPAFFLRSLRHCVTPLAARPARFGSPGRVVSSALTLALGGGVWLGAALPGQAQSLDGLADCAPPQAGEYLLLVVVPDASARAKLDESLPPSVKAPNCNYLGSRVARMGGFRQPENADAWAAYLRDVASLPAFVAKPAAGSTPEVGAIAAPGSGAIAAASSPQWVQDPAGQSGQPPAGQSGQPMDSSQPTGVASPSGSSSTNQGLPADTAFPPPMIDPKPPLATPVDVPPAIAVSTPASTPVSPTAPVVLAPAAAPAVVPAPTPVAQPANGAAVVSPAIAFAPRALGSGYAVLVDYGNQTAVAKQVRQLTQVPVGLASYGQRAYLVARFTPQSNLAVDTLTRLSSAGLRVILVEGNQVTLLTAEVQGQ